MLQSSLPFWPDLQGAGVVEDEEAGNALEAELKMALSPLKKALPKLMEQLESKSEVVAEEVVVAVVLHVHLHQLLESATSGRTQAVVTVTRVNSNTPPRMNKVPPNRLMELSKGVTKSAVVAVAVGVVGVEADPQDPDRDKAPNREAVPHAEILLAGIASMETNVALTTAELLSLPRLELRTLRLKLPNPSRKSQRPNLGSNESNGINHANHVESAALDEEALERRNDPQDRQKTTSRH